MTEKIHCKTAECNAMILHATAEETGGICMPCKQKADRQKREKYLRENRKDVDPFAEVHDRVEIIKIIHQPREHDPLINYLPYPKTITELYAELSEHEIVRLIKYVCGKISVEDNGIAIDITKELAAFTQINISEITKAFVDNNEYYPGYIFRDGSSSLAARLIFKINQKGDLALLGYLLEALAWLGTNNVISQFSQWRKSLPSWASDLYIPVENYAHCAGWELDSNSERRELTLGKCYPLINASSESNSGPVVACSENLAQCKWCGRQITNIFEFDLSDSFLNFIPFTGTKLTIAACEVCSCYSDNFYMNADPKGESSWSSYNEKPEYLPESNEEYGRLPKNKLSLSSKPRLLHHAVDWCLPTTFSQIGGIPSWIQDPDYSQCPKCKNRMTFIAQLSVEDIEKYGEGIYYALLCQACSITSVKYQQT